MRVLILLLVGAALAALTLASTPVPDTTPICTNCTAVVAELQSTWENATSVAEILQNLEEQCGEEHKGLRRDMCDKIAEFIVTIPPKIFEGLENLAWDIPIAVCATFGKCKTPCCSEDSIEQIHLSLTSDDRSKMGVSWVTLHDGDTFVQYSTSSDLTENLKEVTGKISTYTQAGWQGTIHKAIMTGLAPATTYYYKVGGGDMWSPVYSFRTYDPMASQTKFVVVADMGYGNNSDNTTARIKELVDNGEVDVVIHAGDIGYADGYMVHWDTFFNKIQPIASRVPYMVAPGNHEFWYDFAAYKARFFMPGDDHDNEDSETKQENHNNMYYSWTYGNIHFNSMNSETAVDTPNFKQDMLDFFDKDLAAVDRMQTPFVISYFHRPLYCSNDGECTQSADEPNRLTQQAEELLNQHQVDMVLYGHVHSYERMSHIYKGQKVDLPEDGSYAAPVYILQGASGNREGNRASFPVENVPEWSLAHSAELGYATLISTAAQGGSSLKWSFYRASDNLLVDHQTYAEVKHNSEEPEASLRKE